MRKTILAMWLLMPVGFGAYHLGPGQDRMQLDDAAAALAEAEDFAGKATVLEETGEAQAAGAQWAHAAKAYEEALRLLPADRRDVRRHVRLELAKCQMFVAKLPEANAALQSLVDEMTGDPEADTAVLRDARHALANSQYYLTWLMRLEGVGREEWEPTIEAARQTFKLLVEEASAAGDDALVPRGQEDLEAAIRLARMDLTELQGLPLPSQ